MKIAQLDTETATTASLTRSQMGSARQADRNRRLTIVALWVPLLFTLILAFLARQGQRAHDLASHWVLHTVQVKDQLEHLDALVKDVETSQRGYLLTQNTIFLDLYEMGGGRSGRRSDFLHFHPETDRGVNESQSPIP